MTTRSTDLPPDVLTQQELGGTRYILPRRDLGKSRFAGLFVLLFGLFVTGFMIFWMSGPLRGGLEDDGPMKWFLIGFALLGTPGLVVGIGISLLGLFILLNLSHSEVLLSADMLYSIERIGPLRWRRGRALRSIERLVVGRPVKVKNQDGRTYRPLGDDSAGLRAEGSAVKPLWLTPGYPRPLVEALADHLVSQLESSQRGRIQRSEQRIQVVDEPPESVEGVDEVPLEKPAASTAVLNRIKDGLTIAIPAAGLWKGSKGLFFMSLVWNAIVVVIGVVMFAGGQSDSDNVQGETPFVAVLFVGAFLAIGLGLLFSAVNMGKRRLLIAAVGNVLAIRRIGVFGTKEWKVPVADLEAIRIGPSGMEINDTPVMELQIHARGRKKIGVLSQREDDEVRWIASVLRHELGVPARRKG